MEIKGHCDSRFEPTLDVFRRNFTERGDVGASFAVTVEGEFVVDVWAGHRDEAAALPWEKDTIVNVYSTTKTMTALCALLLMDRGELDPNAKVSRYWPEFAQNGKEGVEVRHLLAHTAGLSGLEESIDRSDWYDWDKICSLLAAQAPWWVPGTKNGYHAITQGYLIGEVVRRITGLSLGTFFREALADPLQADFHIGVDPVHFPRIGELIPPPAPPGGDTMAADSIAAKTIGKNMIDAADSRTEAWRRAEIPAANGHGNARSVARVQTLVANHGSAFGQSLLSEAGCERIFEEQIMGDDLVLGAPLRLGMGYGLNIDGLMGPNERTCFWGGWGGSVVVIDYDARVCVSYVMNRMDAGALGDPRGASLTRASLDIACAG